MKKKHENVLPLLDAELSALSNAEAELAWQLPRPLPNPLENLTNLPIGHVPSGHIAFVGLTNAFQDHMATAQ